MERGVLSIFQLFNKYIYCKLKLPRSHAYSTRLLLIAVTKDVF